MSSILFLTQLLPYPLDAGPKTRAYYTLKHLTRKHKVTLLSFSRPNDPPEAFEHLRGVCGEVITVPMPRSRIRDVFAMVRSILTNQPFVITRDTVPEMMRAIEKILKVKSFDYVHADQLWMAQYALHARRFTDSENKKLRVTLDQHNAVYLIPKRMLANARNPIMKLFLGANPGCWLNLKSVYVENATTWYGLRLRTLMLSSCWGMMVLRIQPSSRFVWIHPQSGFRLNYPDSPE